MKPPSLLIKTNKANQALWQPCKFKVASKPVNGEPRIEEKEGFSFKGLGLFKWKLRQVWSVTHLGSGHNIFCVRGQFKYAVEIATMLANLGDWSFSGLRGADTIDPDLRLKTEMLYRMFSAYCFQNGSMERNEMMAEVIAAAQS